MSSTFHHNTGLVISQVERLETGESPPFGHVRNSPSPTNMLGIERNGDKPGKFYIPPTQKQINSVPSSKFLCYLGRENHTGKKKNIFNTVIFIEL